MIFTIEGGQVVDAGGGKRAEFSPAPEATKAESRAEVLYVRPPTPALRGKGQRPRYNFPVEKYRSDEYGTGNMQLKGKKGWPASHCAKCMPSPDLARSPGYY